jgi:hypothetical protein
MLDDCTPHALRVFESRAGGREDAPGALQGV